MPDNIYKIKADKRFKPGHIQIKNGEWRGHPDSVKFKVVELPPLTKETAKITYIDAEKFRLAPPILVTEEMANAIRSST